MNRLGILLLAANSLLATDFLSGQAARAVIGQPYFDSELPGPASANYPGNMLLGSVGGLSWANGVFVVADSSPFRGGSGPQNNRVLIYNNLFGPGDPTSTTGPTQLPPATAAPVAYTNSQYWVCPVCGGRADVVLGQTDFNGTAAAAGASGLQTPTNVATDGVHLAVADTDNNRILLWNQLPTTNGQPADLVLGQPDFNTVTPNTGTGNAVTPSASTLRGPQGVWIRNGQLWVADTMNNRVLAWNTWPTANGQPATLVLGQPNFTTQVQGDLTKGVPVPAANNMLNPVAVSTDGTHLFVTDLGQNRVLIWNTVPTQNQAAADVALGQINLTTAIADNAFTTDSNGVESPVMCTVSNGKNSNGNPTYPTLCEFTLSLPRFALSDGTRLFVADGGNDRVLIYEPIPTASGAAASIVLGEPDFISDNAGGTSNVAAADITQTPGGLAFDGADLFVSEAYTRRVLVFTQGSSPTLIAPRNAASMEVFANALITIGGTPKAGDVLTVTITDASGTATNYTYTVLTGDTLGTISTGVANSLNSSNNGSGDPNVNAIAVPVDDEVRILARTPGPAANSLTLGVSASASATTTIASTDITGGTNESQVAPATLVAIFGQNLTDGDTVSATLDGHSPLPGRLGTAPKAVEAFANGVRMPLLYVSPAQINAQIPYEISQTTTTSVFVRTTHADGSVTVANAVALPVAEGVPGLFAQFIDPSTGKIYTSEPRQVIAMHYSNSAAGAVDLELSGTAPVAGDTVTITIGSASYTYTVQSTDTTLDNVRDNIISLINGTPDPTVTVFAGGQWDRIILMGNTPGNAAVGVAYTATNSTSASVTASAFTPELCCNNTVRGTAVTQDDPAQPGEIVTMYATGLGITLPQPTGGLLTGVPYPLNGPFPNNVADFTNNFVSGIFGNKSILVLNASLMPGAVGVYEIDIMLSAGVTSDRFSQGNIAQSTNVSNEVTLPVGPLQ